MALMLDMLWLFAQTLAVVVGTVFITAVYILRRAHARYAHLPGPPRDSFFLGNFSTLFKKLDNGQMFNSVLFDWCIEYGHTYVLFVMHQPIVISINEAVVKEVLVSGKYDKPVNVYQRFIFLFGSRFFGSGLATELKYSAWALRRAKLNHGFSSHMLIPLMVDFNRLSDDLMEKLTQFADEKKYIRLLNQINRMTIDVIGKAAFQMDLNALNDEHSPFPVAFNKVMEGFNVAVKNPLSNIIPWRATKIKNEVRDALKILRSYARQVLQKRRAAMDRGEYVPQDILSFLMTTFTDDDHDAVEVAVDDFLTMFLAGQDTTANSVSYALLEVGRNPAVLNKAREELDTVLGERSEILYDDLAKMPYLDDIIREALRLCPPAGGSARCVDKDIEIDGLRFPKNTSIVLNTYISSRHPDLHPDPERFWPERWQDESIKPSTYVCYPFLIGSRSCIGMNFAKMEAKVIIAKFLQRFNYEVDPDQSFDLDEKLTMKPKDGVRVRLSVK